MRLQEFEKGLPIYYKDDELTLSNNQFIKEYPDGTKWLISVDDTEQLTETVIKKLI